MGWATFLATIFYKFIWSHWSRVKQKNLKETSDQPRYNPAGFDLKTIPLDLAFRAFEGFFNLPKSNRLPCTVCSIQGPMLWSQFSAIFYSYRRKVGVFLKFLHNLALFGVKNADFFRQLFCENIF
jgi:hypothetical protein